MISVKMFKKTKAWTHTKKCDSRANNTGKKTRGPFDGTQNANKTWADLLDGRRFDRVSYKAANPATINP